MVPRRLHSPPRWLRPFVVDPARFPRVGGRELEPGEDYTLVLEGVDAGGNIVSTRWGPRAFAAGAIVDLTLTL